MNIKNQKGITLMAEVITIVVFMLILGTISYSSISSLQVRALNSMYADILVIQEKALNYYAKTGTAPIDSTQKVDSSSLPSGLIKNPKDDDNGYYRIDMSKLTNLSLNNKHKPNNHTPDADTFYFINTATLTVYYNKGVTIDSLNTGSKQTHYTLPSNYKSGTAPNPAHYQ